MSKLKTVREKKGLTQLQLSEASGIPLRTIQAYESGSRKLVIYKTILTLAMALGCALTDIAD